MLHTHDPRHPTATASVVQARCRARTWHVAALRVDDRGAQWYLSRDDDAPRLIASPPDDVVPLPVRLRARSRRACARQIARLAASSMPAWWPARASTLPIVAEAWQLVPAMVMLSGCHRRLLLADEIGLGKTIAAGVLLHDVHARDLDAATLVVAPAGLVAQWQQELRTRLALDARVLDAEALRQEARHPRHVIDGLRAGGCWIVSLDLLRQLDVTRLLTRTPWTVAVVDEAHLASPGSARLAALEQLAPVCARLLLLSGTPTAAGSAGADALRQLGCRTHERPAMVLCRTSRGRARPRTRTHILDVHLGRAHLALLSRLDRFAARARRERGADALLPALVLRRRALSCPAAFARSVTRRLEVLGHDGDAAQPSLFESAESGLEAEDAQALLLPAWSNAQDERAELETLRRLAEDLPPGGAKLAAVARLVRRARQPALVFTSYVDTLRVLRDLLTDARVVIIHGDQPDALRRAAVDAFTSGDADVLLATDAAAEGLNLQARSRLVVHVEVPVSARVFLQRTGRVDRYGQTRRVHAVVLSSHALEDRRAIGRLQADLRERDTWVAAVTTTACRRTRQAERLAARHASVNAAAHARTPMRSRLTPRRWRRLAVRLGLPSEATRLWIGRLRLHSHPLSAHIVDVVVATADTSPAPHTWTAAEWHVALPAAVDRATRLHARVTAWQREAEHAAARARARDDAADLFTEALTSPAAEVPRPAAGLVAGFEVVVVLERQERGR